MLTIVELKTVNFILWSATKLYLFPHDWKRDEKNSTIRKRFLPTKSRLKRIGVYINTVISLIYVLFLVIRLVPSVGVYSKKELKSLSFELMVHYFWLSVHFTCFAIQCFGLQYSEEFSWFYNQLVLLNKSKGQQHFGKPYRKSSLIEKILILLVAQLGVVCLFFVIIFAVVPNHRHYPYSVLKNYNADGIYTYFIFIFIEFYLTFRAGIYDAFYVVYGFFYVFSFNYWLRHTCVTWIKNIENWFKDCRTDFYKASGKDILNTYSCLYILNTTHNFSIAKTCVPAMKTCIESLAILTLFGTIRFVNRLHPIVYGALPIAAILFTFQSMLVITLLSNIHTYSLQIGSNFRNELCNLKNKPNSGKFYGKNEEKYWKKVIISRRPIQSKIGTPYFVEKSTKLKYAGILIDSVLSLLVATKNRREMTNN